MVLGAVNFLKLCHGGFSLVYINCLSHSTPSVLIFMHWHEIANQMQRLVSRVWDGGEGKVPLEMPCQEEVCFWWAALSYFYWIQCKKFNQLMLNDEIISQIIFPLGCGSKKNQAFLKLYSEDQRDITVASVVSFLEHSCQGCLWNFLISPP